MSVILLPESVRAKLGDAADDFIKLLNEVADARTEQQRITEFKLSQATDLAKEFTGVRKEIADVRVEIKETKSEIIKWMFIFWIGQLVAIFGFLKFFGK
ncbi:MAG TPA: hypothetical protein PKA28_13510 [Methylomusa anaerophila]|uniref:Uncharacterized protein n=1 Tax=Methylomusa anaerophila TaxID=1930071 RepID=A0A348AKL1_9FIRM|nr:hypothetical protein [Methylomusa anaerophila]BBB91609.1 hypothetical protein MAMMFC1_02293 [Methylomusa anaerophila]HML89453.1 hypothetical protein [Methylomusa anaerophila]